MTAEKSKKRGAELTHLDEKGRARMVDISSKRVTARAATARASVMMQEATLDLVLGAGIEKGDVLGTARIAGIMAAKKTSELIPMCHPIAITSVEMEFEVDRKASTITAVATARTRDRTGIEMEALTAAAVAALTIYDMCKAVDRAMTISSVQLLKKSGGRSGTFARDKE
ncbi:MAG: cyclic pyranopterin monophosphate synthase MoaC [Actinomycetota bacterium]|nr:cyclic pyranopterin monophosphate synthase MoaC [Actinomycetota bacterium]